MYHVADIDALLAIQAVDPDGVSPTEPTRAMYLAHERWAVERYGRDIWKIYCRGGWAESPTGPNAGDVV